MLRSIVLAAALMPTLATAAANDVAPWPKIGEATRVAIGHERAARSIPSLMVGIVDRSGLVWSGGAGHADADSKTPVNADTLYGIGGLTQLFTGDVLRSFAARGVVDLDAPVQRYVPSFQPRNPFGGEVTLRNLLEHRSGLVREPPTGNYFDVQAATLAETVTSLNATALVVKPGTDYKYSNAGYAVIGRVLEVVSNSSFEQVLQKEVFTPLQMARTSLHPADKAAVAHALIAPFDGERFAAPMFATGVAPSVGAYSSVADLARFAQTLLTREADSSSTFTRSKFDGRDAITHSGAAYGYVSDVTLFPADGIGIITLIAIDDATPALHRIRDFTARQVFAALKKQRKPVVTKTDAVLVGLAHRLEGHYSDGTRSLDIRILDQRLFIEAPAVVGELRQRAGQLIIDDLATFRDDLQVDTKARTVTLDGATYRRLTWEKPVAASAEFEGLIGEYGWNHNFARIYERDGEVYARVEWSHHHKLERIAKDAYRFPNAGPYAHEEMRFTRDERGVGMAISLSGLVLPRRDFGAELEARSRTNARFVPELLVGARKISPPAQPKGLRKPDLVEVNTIEPSTKLDVRYATSDNFMGYPFYDSPRFFLQRPAADALIRAHRKLGEQGLGIALIDGYRPWHVTRMFWDSVPAESRAFVADPSQGSRHNRGCAADISMFDRATGEIVDMPGRYDEPSSRSSPLHLGGTSLQRWRRDLLKRAMEAEGYDVYTNEWWHFDYGEWRKYPVMNFEFSEIAR